LILLICFLIYLFIVFAGSAGILILALGDVFRTDFDEGFLVVVGIDELVDSFILVHLVHRTVHKYI